MKKLKFLILFIILAITVGIAAVSSNLLINGSTPIASNPDDFLVYFSDVLVDGTQDLSLVQSETSLSFNAEFTAVGDKKEITYDITNASKNYDADIDITCTQSTEYLSIINDFDTSSNLAATSTRTGVLTVALSKSYIGSDLKQEISCTISASAVERSSQGSGSVAGAVDPYYIGREISIGEEKFNVISIDATTVTMLAKYGIDNDSKQSFRNPMYGDIVGYDDECGFEPGVFDFEIQQYTGDITYMLNGYVDYLKTFMEDDSITGDLLSLSQLYELGCSVPTDYKYGDGGWTCKTSPHASWLAIANSGYYFFLTKSAIQDPIYDLNVWTLQENGDIGSYSSCGLDGMLRPTITISKETLDYLSTFKRYVVGEVVTIGNEEFNVIGDNGKTVSLLAKYNLSEMDSMQSVDDWPVFYTSEEDTGLEDYVIEYKNKLSSYLGVDGISGELLTIDDLVNLGCLVPDASIYNGVETCVDSPYRDWLVNGQEWWTSSIIYDTNRWGVSGSGELIDVDIYDLALGVRPVITIPKEVLNTQIISFTISGDIYFAENGMTWGEWVVSKYNVTDNIKILDDYIFIDEFILGDYDLFFVFVGDSILANHSYMSSGVSYS